MYIVQPVSPLWYASLNTDDVGIHSNAWHRGGIAHTLSLIVKPEDSDAPPPVDVVLHDHRAPDLCISMPDRTALFGPDDFASGRPHISGRFTEAGHFAGQVSFAGHASRPFHWAPPAGTQPPGVPCSLRLTRMVKGHWESGWLKCERFGGIIVYRNGLRVLPYGQNRACELLDDRVDASLVSGLYCEVHLPSDTPLNEKTGREGFRDSIPFQSWKTLLAMFLQDLGANVFPDQQNFHKPSAGSHSTQTVSSDADKLQAARSHLQAAPEAVRNALQLPDPARGRQTLEDIAHSLNTAPVGSSDPSLRQAEASLKGQRDIFRTECLLPAIRQVDLRALADMDPDAKRAWFTSGIQGTCDEALSRMHTAAGRARSAGDEALHRSRSALAQAFDERDGWESLFPSQSPEDDVILEQWRDLHLVPDGDGWIPSPSEVLAALEGECDRLRHMDDATAELRQMGMAVHIIEHEFISCYRSLSHHAQRLKNFTADMESFTRMCDGIASDVQSLGNMVHLLGDLMLSHKYGHRNWQAPRKGTSIHQILSSLFAHSLRQTKAELVATPAFRSQDWGELGNNLSVFTALVDNALFWMRDQKGPRVVCLDCCDADSIVVSDTGPGIRDADREAVFALGFTRKPRGRGLGLPYARAVLNRIDWELTLAPPLRTRSSHSTGCRLRIRRRRTPGSGSTMH